MSANQRLSHLQDWLKQEELSYAFLSHPTNIFYISGFKCDPHERVLGCFIFPDDEPFLICPAMEVPQAKSSGWSFEIIGYHDHEDPWEKIKEAHDRRNHLSNQVAIESSFLPYENAQRLTQYLTPHATLISIEKTIQSLRMIKDEKEIAILRQAAEVADDAVQVGCDAIHEGQTEMAIVATIEYELAKKGFSEMAFTTMVLAGENSALPHGHPGQRQIHEGDFVLFDLGVVVDGYCSDITRTVAYKKVNDKQKEIYNTVLRANTAAIRFAQVNTRLGDLDLISRNIINDAGFGDYYPHRLGHGLGLEAHEAPSISQNNDQLISKGFVFTVEPGIYVPDIGGVRIEDDIYIGANGPEVLTKFSKTLQIYG